MQINWNDGTTTTKNNEGQIITYKNNTMQLYKFVYTYKDGNEATYFRACKYPKKTSIYQHGIKLLDQDKLNNITWSQFL